MLSITSTVLLGLISEKPMNPYEALRYINLMEVRRWFPISDSTVYTNVRTLAKKGLISGQQVQENNMPPKKVYSITKEGQRELAINIEELIAGSHIDYVSFNLGIIFSDAIGIEQTIKIVKKRLAILNEYRQEMANQRTLLIDNNASSTVVTAQRRNTLLIETEINVTNDYLAIISASDFKISHITYELDKLNQI